MHHGMLLSALILLSAPAVAPAQSPDNPAENPALYSTQTGVDKPLTAVKPADPVAERIASLLTGSFSAPATERTPALWFHAAPVSILGFDNALYFEFARDDSPGEPFQQGIISILRGGEKTRLRIHSFARGQGAPLVGLWAAPRVFPSIDPALDLHPLMDVFLSEDSKGFTGQTTCAYPVSRDGAIEADSRITMRDGTLKFEDRAFDAAGERIWGLSADDAPLFRRADPPYAPRTLDTGLIIITLKAPPPDAPVLAENGEVSVHYTGWLTNGFEFDSSRAPGREPYTLRVPGPVIKGWNEGLKGIAKGERRRLILPSELAYGERGRPPRIPPNSTLVFDIEALHINNTPPEEPQVPPFPGINPPPRPQPATGSPTGANPENTPK